MTVYMPTFVCMDCGKEIDFEGVCDECLTIDHDDRDFVTDDDIDFINNILYEDLPEIMRGNK
jgi:hypothetical protein